MEAITLLKMKEKTMDKTKLNKKLGEAAKRLVVEGYVVIENEGTPEETWVLTPKGMAEDAIKNLIAVKNNQQN